MKYGNLNERQAGILMPVASLPNPYGIGDFGKETYQFIDICKQFGFKIWQILPLNPLGFGSSPYQPFSSFAFDELYISLDLLCEADLIDPVDCFHFDEEFIDYEAIRSYKEPYLRKAYQKFKKNAEYQQFLKRAFWLEEYSEFICLKQLNHNRIWLEWEDYLANDVLEQQKEYIKFLQYILYTQWMKVKEYANQNGIHIMGDIPFYVGLDSADVYFNRESFLLNKKGYPTSVAGVPPDYFSKYGQLWGNPIYDFEYLKENDFEFWVQRIKWNQDLYDSIRIDHFRAFDTYWKIPANETTAINGEWVLGPGYDLFDCLFEKYPDVRLIAEDLGDLRKEVLELRDHYQLLGMRIIQYSFGRLEESENFYIAPYCIAYTGTHDNDPVKGWYRTLDKNEQRRIRHILKSFHYYDAKTMPEKVLYRTLDCNALIAMVQVQDILLFDETTRINHPGTIGFPNWCWRLSSYQALKKQIKKINQWLLNTNRI